MNEGATFEGPGVLIHESTKEVLPVSSLVNGEGGLSATFPDGSVVDYAADDITVDEKTGTLTFASSDEVYHVRDFRETDGLWMSRYKTVLPYEALQTLAASGRADNTVIENLHAHALADSPYVVGLTYSDGSGQWARLDGTWVPLGDGDTTYANDEMENISIDPARADEFIDLYDANYVTVSDADEFEASESQDGEDGFVPADENDEGGPADKAVEEADQTEE